MISVCKVLSLACTVAGVASTIAGFPPLCATVFYALSLLSTVAPMVVGKVRDARRRFRRDLLVVMLRSVGTTAFDRALDALNSGSAPKAGVTEPVLVARTLDQMKAATQIVKDLNADDPGVDTRTFMAHCARLDLLREGPGLISTDFV